ncbi:hypothetical protein [Weissella cibaria]|uniref:hypothetical protein n=1 Tax=Weissella cibaria TaxID=137591 RepID=UPI001FD6A880|nr:hypothetical protein [Weissella cibaria]
MSVKEARRILKRAYGDFQFHLDENEVSRALMSRLWKGFFWHREVPHPENFSKPGF